MDDGGRDDSSFPSNSRQPSPDGNEWRRTGRRGRKSYPHPVARDDRPKTRKPDWHELEPTFKPVWEMIDSVLRKDERYAFIQRYLVGMSYAEIAETARPKMSDRKQAHRIVKRARKKLNARVGRKIPNQFSYAFTMR
jgi:DNA-directed RNA polymerase specialized sigma24 family protein